jgi:hypothetical protein
MAKYTTRGLGQTSNNVLLSHGVIASNATPRRFKVLDMMFGSAASPNDGTFYIVALRTTTAAGTSTGANPNPVDPADAAAITTAGVTFTVNPTLSTILWDQAFNQRSTVRWFAAPGEEFVVPRRSSPASASSRSRRRRPR